MTDWKDWLKQDPAVCGGRLVAAGTRVMVTVILDNVAGGESEAAILAAYPTLRREHVRAALLYAADLARQEAELPLAGG